VLLLAIFAYVLATYGADYPLARLVASSFFVLGMLVGAVVLFVLLRLYMRLRLFYHVISYSIRASERNLPEIFRIAGIAATRLGMEPPRVYVVQDPEINAYAPGFRKKIIVINTGLIDVTDDAELTFIIGHEISHVKYGWTVPLHIPGITLPVPLLFGSQQREYTCDRGGLVACRDLDKSVLALAKLALGKNLASKIDISKFYLGEKEVDGDRISQVSEALASHPPIRERVLHLREFYKSELYKELARRRVFYHREQEKMIFTGQLRAIPLWSVRC
jgi:Zn-dependent protease with chaperone function